MDLKKITAQELQDIFDAYEILKEDYKRDIYSRQLYSYEGRVNTENDLKHFIRLCELLAIWDKVGSTYYNAKKVIGE
jgi:hypothetical protein